MKNYKITVNGYEYDVTVEEVAGDASNGTASVPVKKVVSAPANKPAAATTQSNGGGSVKITSPMPGKILAVKVANNTSVKKGDVLAVLEAMKMENEIVAPQDGTIASVNVSEGATVETGTLIITMN